MMRGVAPFLLAAVGVVLLLAWLVAVLRPGWWAVAAILLLLLAPGRWWRWRIRGFRRGVKALRAGDTDRARRELEAFLDEWERDPGLARVQPLFNLGRRYSYRAAALGNLGVVALEEGRPGEALGAFRAALEEDPAAVRVRYGEAAALRLLGRAEEAERSAAEALERHPRYVAARLLLALIRRERDDEAGAEEALRPLREEGEEPEPLLERLRGRWSAPADGDSREPGDSASAESPLSRSPGAPPPPR